MKLSRLKNAWRILSSHQNLDTITEEEILSVISTTPVHRVGYVILQNVLLFVLLLLGCHSG